MGKVKKNRGASRGKKEMAQECARLERENKLLLQDLTLLAYSSGSEAAREVMRRHGFWSLLERAMWVGEQFPVTGRVKKAEADRGKSKGEVAPFRDFEFNGWGKKFEASPVNYENYKSQSIWPSDLSGRLKKNKGEATPGNEAARVDARAAKGWQSEAARLSDLQGTPENDKDRLVYENPDIPELRRETTVEAFTAIKKMLTEMSNSLVNCGMQQTTTITIEMPDSSFNKFLVDWYGNVNPSYLFSNEPVKLYLGGYYFELKRKVYGK